MLSLLYWKASELVRYAWLDELILVFSPPKFVCLLCCVLQCPVSNDTKDQRAIRSKNGVTMK